MPPETQLIEQLIASHTLVILVGPTASGKTRTSIQLAHALGGPSTASIISADSRLVYQGLDIGTAKPTQAEREGIPHAMIDIARPTEVFTAGDYAHQATQAIEATWRAQQVPILAGGTGFYFQSLLQPNLLPTVPIDPDIRQQLQHTQTRPGGAQQLHMQLHTLDPDRAAVIHPNDTLRVIRALEICLTTGKPTPKVNPMAHQAYNYRCIWLGLQVDDPPWHHQIIHNRIEDMVAQGWLAEVEALQHTWGETAHALRVTHGYPELGQVIAKKMTLETAKAQILIQVRQYAKRQRVWFQRNPNIHWISAKAHPEAITDACLAHLWASFA